MIIKGKSRSGPGSLATHLSNAEKNERVELIGSRGTIASDLRGALVEMDAYAAGSKCEKPLYHAALSPEPPHRLTDEQRIEAADALERKLGLDGHARVIVLHEKLGREHLHIVWSRIDLATMKSISDSHNYRKHEECSRDLERRFGHDRVQGAHAERDGVARPDRTPSRAELRQEERTGIVGKEVKEQVSGLFRASDGPEAFKSALEANGYQLAKGDRRDLVIVDPAGGIHSLARRIDTMKAADLTAFMAPLDHASLPNVGDIRSVQRLAFEARDEADEVKAYGRSGAYVAQSQAALSDHLRRQKELDGGTRSDSTWDRIEAGEEARKQRDDEAAKSGAARISDDQGVAPHEGGEMTDAKQARLDRLREVRADILGRLDPGDRQNEAPGEGHSRSR